MKAIPVYVYRQADGSDTTNGGISSRYNRLLLICDNGFIEVDENNPPENLVKLVVREFPDMHFGFETVYHVEPVARPDSGNFGWMAGGNFVYSSDSRLSEMVDGMYGALSVHDRQETREEYLALSR